MTKLKFGNDKLTTMKKQQWITKSPEETTSLGKKIAKLLKPGTVVALSGNLGSGKTTFLKGLTAGLGLKNADAVTSPTFSLMHIYDSKPRVYHFDLYRLESEKEVLNIGFEEFVSDPEAITCVEWAEKAPGLMPENVIKIQFEVMNENQRRIQIM